MLRKFNYLYQNPLSSKDLRKDELFEGEKIMYKIEDVKLEDDNSNVAYENNCYFTNFRILIINNKTIYDIPLAYIIHHYVKKPMLYGSNYIYLQIADQANRNKLPQYIIDFYFPQEVIPSLFQFPNYMMLKFRGKDSNIDEAYNYLKMILNSRDWNISYKKKELKNDVNEGLASMTISKTNYEPRGTGIEKIKNMQNMQMRENEKKINDSFSDLDSLRNNTQEMITLAQVMRGKLANMNQDSKLNEINGILSKIGFIDPVTKETSGKDYYIELGKQINEFFVDYFNKNSIGILTLIDAYHYYNRARGMNTISPKDMRRAIEILEYSPNKSINIKSFKNDMILLYTNDFSLENIFQKIEKYLNEKEEISLGEFTEYSKTKNMLLSKLLLEEMLEKGLLCLDESDLDLKYSRNKILDYKL